MKKVLALLLALALIFVAAGCIIIETNGSKNESENPTKASEETKEPETKEPETKEPETDPEPALGFAPGLYVYENKGATEYYLIKDIQILFEEDGTFFVEVTYGDGVGGKSIGNYTVTEEAVNLYYWFDQDGPSYDVDMYGSSQYRLVAEDSLLFVMTMSQTEHQECYLEREKVSGVVDAFRSDHDVIATITERNLLTYSDYPQLAPAAQEHPAVVGLYRYQTEFPGLFDSHVLILFENGRFSEISYFKDDAGKEVTIGNYVVKDGEIQCLAWFAEAEGTGLQVVRNHVVHRYEKKADGTLVTDAIHSYTEGKSVTMIPDTDPKHLEDAAASEDIGPYVILSKIYNDAP